MRNLKEEPLTVADILVALDSAKQALYLQKEPAVLLRKAEFPELDHEDLDDMSLALLMEYIENKDVQVGFARFLEAKQPKVSIDSGLDKLSNKTLERLLAASYGNYRRNVWEAAYRGVSIRGSHVYDLNPTAPNKLRFYVRIQDGAFRGEVNEDNFTMAVRSVANGPLRPRVEVNDDTPVSGLGEIWAYWKKIWNEDAK